MLSLLLLATEVRGCRADSWGRARPFLPLHGTVLQCILLGRWAAARNSRTFCPLLSVFSASHLLCALGLHLLSFSSAPSVGLTGLALGEFQLVIVKKFFFIPSNFPNKILAVFSPGKKKYHVYARASVFICSFVGIKSKIRRSFCSPGSTEGGLSIIWGATGTLFPCHISKASVWVTLC